MATSRVIQPTSNPYGGGAVIFDSSPYVQYALNQHAKEQAKQESLDNYFRTIDSKINPAGMRTQEVAPLLQQQNNDRLFYLKNRDAIIDPTKDNGKSYNEYLQRNQAKMAFIEQSKQAAEKYKPIAAVLADPTKRSLVPDEFFSENGALHLHDLPINDPRHQDIDVASLNFNPKPFDDAKYRTSLTPYVKEVPAQTTLENNPDYATSFLRTPKTQMVQQFDKNQIAQRAEDEYKQNPSYRKLINDIGANPTQYAIHNDIYKQAFGKDLDIQHPEQIAIAHTLSMLPKNYTKEGTPQIDQVAFQAAKTKQSEAFRQKLHDDTEAQSNRRAANLIAAGAVDAPQKYLDNAGTGNKFAGSDMDEESYPNSVLSEFGKTVQVKKDPNSEKVSDLKVNPVIVQNPSTKQRLLVYPIVNSKGEITPEYDIKNSTPVTDQALKTVLGDKVFNSKIKGTQFVGDKKVTTPSSTKIPDWIKKK